MLWSCTSLSVVYRQDDGPETVALRDISLNITAGERIAILGPNGSGKSTLALVIAGLLKPSAGDVLCNGTPVLSPTGAMVFQSPDDNLLGETVREELRFCLESKVDLRELTPATDAVLLRFGLQSLADRQTSQLSGGEKQVVAVACAMISGQSIIVLDEPTSHLDPPGKKMLWTFLEEATRNATHPPAIVVVTQYRNEVGNFDRIVSMKSGAITYDGPPTQAELAPPTQTESISFPVSDNSEPLLTVRELSQVETPGWRLPAHPVRAISLDINHGEAIALCGPIGAGKTTLALLLSGLITKFEGERNYRGSPPVMLTQFPERQIFCNSVLDEVAYGLIARGIPRSQADALAREALLRTGLDPGHFGKRDPHSLSGGQKRRVMLAVAASIESPLYILDEPQAALDEEGVQALRGLCSNWLDRKSSYILVSHDFEFLRSLTSRVIVLHHGRIMFDDTWSTLNRSQNLLSSIGFD